MTTLFRHTTAVAAVPDLLAIAERWTADVFVRAAEEFGACLAAELRGLPHAVSGRALVAFPAAVC